jgi:hypothetical protein
VALVLFGGPDDGGSGGSTGDDGVFSGTDDSPTGRGGVGTAAGQSPAAPPKKDGGDGQDPGTNPDGSPCPCQIPGQVVDDAGEVVGGVTDKATSLVPALP